MDGCKYKFPFIKWPIFPGDLFVSGSVHPGKWTFWTWKSLVKRKNTEKHLSQTSIFGFKKIHFPGCMTSEVFLFRMSFHDLCGTEIQIFCGKMLFDGIGLRSSTLLTAFQPNHGKSAGSFFGKRQKTSNISKLWLEFWEQDHQIVFNAYNNMIWYTDIGVHWLYTLEAKWPIVILIEKGLVLEGST